MKIFGKFSVIVLLVTENFHVIGIVLASGRLELSKILQGFVRSVWRQPCIDGGSAEFRYELLPLGLRYDDELVGLKTDRGCLVTNGTPGRIQFYDLEKEKQIFSVKFFFIFDRFFWPVFIFNGHSFGLIL